MRTDLEKLSGKPTRFRAEVGYRRNNIRFAGKVAQQRLLLNISSEDNSINIDHLVLTVGREIPAIPIVYSRIVTGAKIEFDAVPFIYVRASNKTKDYSLKITKLHSSHLGGF